MMSNTKALLLALIFACRALAAPLTATAISDSRAEIQAVIDALKVQVNAFNPSAASLVDDIESELTRSGVLSEENIKLLDDKIKAMSPNGVNTTAIAEQAVHQLWENGVFEASDSAQIEQKAITVTTEMVQNAISIGALDCPHKGRICGGCVIL